MGFRYEEINNRNEQESGGVLTYIFAISWDCFDLKSSDYSLRKILGSVFLLRLLLAVQLVV